MPQAALVICVVVALHLHPAFGIGQFYNITNKTCMSDWTKVTPVMRDHVDDTFFQVSLYSVYSR
jgi:hypothetical protein